MTRTLILVAVATTLASCIPTSAYAESELAVMKRGGWSEYEMNGKEADAIEGDFLLRNDLISLVIAQPIATRNANMTVKRVGGCIIDLGPREKPNDQLSCLYPLGSRYIFSDPDCVTVFVDGEECPLPESESLTGKSISVRIESNKQSDGTYATVTYTLADDAYHVQIDTVVQNPTDNQIEVTTRDTMRADRSFQFGVAEENRLFWAYDEWFRACYGIVCLDQTLRRGSSGVTIEYLYDGAPKQIVDAGGQYKLTRHLFPAENSVAARGLARKLSDQSDPELTVATTDAAGPVRNARVVLKQGDQVYGVARTRGDGLISFPVPTGEYQLEVSALGRPTIVKEINVDRASKEDVEMEESGYVRVVVKDSNGEEIPCKVSFYGEGDTDDPFFGPDSKAIAVHNAFYTSTGTFRTQIGPGEYQVVISRGPEYDAIVEAIMVERGDVTRINAVLERVVDSSGWVSTEYHSHSSPSGDNTSMQFGRVLNLLAEDIEFAPCTEHNRISSYMPHIRRLDAMKWLATCSGMELTGGPLPVNHQNAFPLKRRFRQQDGGGPVTDVNPVVQIERLAMWDNGSDKLVQTNHPNLIQIYGDGNNDRTPDGGFREMFQHMDVMEIHPPARIFERPTEYPNPDDRGNTIFCWLQLLNLGYRIPGVVNTDAHYNFHGSGWLRNYVKSSTDAPAEITVDEMVQNSENGHVVMTTGPFLNVQLSGPNSDKSFGPGDDVDLPNGKAELHIQVQCANWLDVNRVQIFVNGEMREDLNYTRRTHADWFSNEVVKFDQSIPIELKSDAHIIVAVAGEGLQLGRVMGEQRGTMMPVAVTNPIFVDVDGDGFQANGDLLGAPFPVVDQR